jgi:antitoxin component YwqK of YwqJK toxin-antitoxin module
MEQINEQTEVIPESSTARWAWRMSLIPVLGIPLFIALAFISLYCIGQGRTGFWLLRRGVIAVFAINVLPYCAVYLFGYSMYFPWVYENLYSYLPRHGVMVEHDNSGFITEKYYHFFFGGKKIKVEAYYQSHKMLDGELISNMPKFWEGNIIEHLNNDVFRTGKWTMWYSNGKKCGEGECTKDGYYGAWKYWSPDGKEQSAVLYTEPGKATGKIWRELCGEIFSETYVQGDREGKYQSWDLNGRKLDEGNYLQNKQDGPWTECDVKYNYSSGEYRNGKRIGVWYHKNSAGILKTEETYGDDGLVIKTIEYINGIKCVPKGETGEYNRKVGVWKYHDPNGKVVLEETYNEYGFLLKAVEYQDGKPGKTTLYAQDGHPIENKK